MRVLFIGVLLTICGSAVSAGEIAQRFDSLAKHGFKAPTTLPADDKGRSITEIGIERAESFLLHSRYCIILKRDGSFRYEGEDDIGQPARCAGQAGANQFERLAAYVAASGFMDLENAYDSRATDQDTYYAMVVTDGGVKIVKGVGAAVPVNVWAIEMIIRGMVSNPKWEHPPTTRPAKEPTK